MSKYVLSLTKTFEGLHSQVKAAGMFILLIRTVRMEKWDTLVHYAHCRKVEHTEFPPGVPLSQAKAEVSLRGTNEETKQTQLVA